ATLKDYDAANRLIKTTFADGSFSSNEYDAAGRMTASIDTLGNRTEYSYDAAGRQTQVRDALGNIIDYAYDKHGNRTHMTDAKGQIFSYEYDLEDRLLRTNYPDGTFTRTDYDVRGRKISETDQAGVTTRYQYDAAGRLTKVIDVLNQQTSYSYDEQGNKLTQTDAAGRTTSWTYDELGRVLTRTLPMGQVESFSYDATGNIQSRTDFNGQTTSYIYDINNRVTQITYDDSSTETFTYDNNGNRLTAESSQGLWLYAYDAFNRLTAETKPTGEILEYSYDAAGNKIQLKVTYQNTTTRVENSSYDVLNRLQSVTDNNQNVTGYGYDQNGNRASVANANGTSTIYAYDNLNRLIKVSHYNGTGGLINAFDYTLSAAGRRTQIVESGGRTSNYNYDELYRLTSETISDSVNGNYTAVYTYDAVGNRLTEITNGIITSYSYDANDRLIQQGSTSYSYDNNGNTLSKIIGRTGGANYSYNTKNKLISLYGPNASASYQYNIDGIRIAKVENGMPVNYLVDQNRDYAQVITETTATNVTDYVYGDDLLTQSRQGQTFTYHYDGLGSTRLLTDGLGNNTDSYDYEAFGETLNKTGTTENSYLFTGEQFDAGLGDYYLRARYYDQGVGRFTQMDEWRGNIIQPVTLNKYTYANIDPVNWIDPSGHFGLADFTVTNQMRTTLISQVGPSYARMLARTMWGEVKDTIKDQALEQVFGIVGGYVLDNMVAAVDDVADIGQSAQSFGSTAHKNLKDSIEETAKKLNKSLKKYNVRLDVEVFFFEDGMPTINKKRSKGSMGLDVILVNVTTGKVVLAFDLKTGKSGTSKSKLPGYKKRHNNAPIIDIFVRRKK
ncbi:MAG: hypothetical protein OEY89_10940, partial [Gammaproteobacteria bacterium]|nr:hypothetical protein [Gammaproteobacteria bacterium]